MMHTSYWTALAPSKLGKQAKDPAYLTKLKEIVPILLPEAILATSPAVSHRLTVWDSKQCSKQQERPCDKPADWP